MPQASVDRLAANEDIKIVPYENFWIHLATPNFEKAPTDNKLVRQAIATALDMEEIMLVATDGAYNTNYGFQTQDRNVYSDAGSEHFNVNDPEKAKALLEEAGYAGEELVLLTNRDYNTMYNAALVMAEQLQDIGMNVRVEVQDWPATIATRNTSPDAWNYHFTGWLDMRLDKMLNERGDNISPGQVQRLSLARVFAKKSARFVVLDEATSGLDGSTQAELMEELRAHANGRALVMVAHRLDTLRWADRIIVLDQGRIVQSGTYGELSSSPGAFAKLLGEESPARQLAAEQGASSPHLRAPERRATGGEVGFGRVKLPQLPSPGGDLAVAQLTPGGFRGHR